MCAYCKVLAQTGFRRGRKSLPVSCTNVAAVIGGDTTTVDDDSENHEAETGSDLDDADNEFDLFESACCSLR